MQWKNDGRNYACGELLYLGPWQVGAAHLDSCVPRGARDRYRATCALPGISQGLGLYETQEAARERVEKAVRSWLEKLPSNPGANVTVSR